MPREIRNLKGEIVSETDPEDRLLDFGSSTWLLIGGLALFNIGCFFNPNLIDSIFRMLDIRLWPWSYCIILGIIVLFSIKWFFIYSRWEDYDGNEADSAMRFVRLSVAISVGLVLWAFLRAAKWPVYFYDLFARWIGYGEFSWTAALIFVFLLGVATAFVYLFKEWVVVFWER